MPSRRARTDGGAVEATAVDSHAPRIAIVGRPNVGKSTLFNRLVGKRTAIVHGSPGVTRDRNEAVGQWDGRAFRFVDTGGFETDETDGLSGEVLRQSQGAIGDADVVVMVFDGRAGLSPADREAVTVLRRSGKPVVYTVNKVDTAGQQDLVYDFADLGVDPLIAVSAEHSGGLDALMEAVVARAPALAGGGTEPAQARTRLALVGRPNVGKSSLLNRLVGYERAIVDATPGTTRDPLDTPVTLGKRAYLLVDTAGIRRRSRITERLEQLTVVRSLRTIERAEIIVLVVDALEGITDQDARIAAYAWRLGRGVAVLVNKWDLMESEGVTEARWLADQRERRPAFASLPALCVSAATGWHLDRVPRLVAGVEEDFAAELPTRRLNQVLRTAVDAHSAPMVRGRTPRFFYATQFRTRPPAVAVFTSDPGGVHSNYVRYLRGQLAAAFGLRAVKLQLEFRGRH